MSAPALNYTPVVQRLERTAHNGVVAGSNPAGDTADIAQWREHCNSTTVVVGSSPSVRAKNTKVGTYTGLMVVRKATHRLPWFRHCGVPSQPITIYKTVRFQHPFYRTGRRFSVPACLRQTHNYYHRYLRNVSHLKLRSRGAPTSRPVTNMTGRFFRCRNSLSEIRKIFSGIGK